MKLKLIVVAAVGFWNERRVIGEENRMPWFLPRDLRFFRTVTENHSIIMGRKTFESIGGRVLPRRRNIIVTRQKEYLVTGGEVAHSLEEAVALAVPDEYAFVIGGGELYRQAVPVADHLLLTQICHKSENIPLFPVFRGDTFFPQILDSEWTCVKLSRWFRATSAKSSALVESGHHFPLSFRFLRFDKTENANVDAPTKLFFGHGKVYKPRTQTMQLDCEPSDQSTPTQLSLLPS